MGSAPTLYECSVRPEPRARFDRFARSALFFLRVVIHRDIRRVRGSSVQGNVVTVFPKPSIDVSREIHELRQCHLSDARIRPFPRQDRPPTRRSNWLAFGSITTPRHEGAHPLCSGVIRAKCRRDLRKVGSGARFLRYDAASPGRSPSLLRACFTDVRLTAEDGAFQVIRSNLTSRRTLDLGLDIVPEIGGRRRRTGRSAGDWAFAEGERDVARRERVGVSSCRPRKASALGLRKLSRGGSAPSITCQPPSTCQRQPQLSAKADADGDGGWQMIEGLRDHHPGQ